MKRFYVYEGPAATVPAEPDGFASHTEAMAFAAMLYGTHHHADIRKESAPILEQEAA